MQYAVVCDVDDVPKGNNFFLPSREHDGRRQRDGKGKTGRSLFKTCCFHQRIKRKSTSFSEICTAVQTRTFNDGFVIITSKRVW